MKKKNDLIDMRKSDEDTLQKRLKETRKKYYDFIFKQSAGKSVKPSEINSARKDIAKILTVMKENEIIKRTEKEGKKDA